MEKDDVKRILEKIRKLTALSKSSNEHEAALALAKAQELMELYKITPKDMLAFDVEETMSKSKMPVSKNQWQSVLISLCEKKFHCSNITKWQMTKSGYQPKLSFYGVYPSNELASYFFDMIYVQVVRLRKEFVETKCRRYKKSNKTILGDNYAYGVVYGIYDKIIDTCEPVNPTSIEKIKAYTDKNYSNAVTTKMRTSTSKKYDNVGWSEGFRDSSKVNISQGVNGGQTAKQLNS